ncbi:MAG: hypothetical protein JWO23_2108 [Solirubrobacterales bacterium]|nr:hypothetical protein [Solirubrobacterales bacterium]
MKGHLGNGAHGSSRWLAVGQSSDHDAARAGEAAAAAALVADDARLLVVFCSHSYDLDALLGAINSRSGGVPLIGCSTAGEIATEGPGDAGVVVTALGGPGFSVSTISAENASDDLRAAGADVGRCALALNGHPNRVLMLLTDGLAGDQQEIVRGAYGVVGASVPLVGGCAGDGLEMRSTYQLHNDRVMQNAVVGAALGSEAPLGIGVRHGWRRVGEPVVVTRSSDNRVYTLNDRRAVDVYFEHLDPPADARRDSAAFTRFALTHPLGLSGRSHEDHVRFVGEANFDDGSIGFIAEVPQGGLAWFMEGDAESVLEATGAACADALAALDGGSPLGMIAFDCIARRGVLGDDGISSEVSRIAQIADGAPVAGFYTYGEIARTHGQSGFHNQTLVVLAVG